MIPVAVCLPWCGFLFGYVFSFVLPRGHRESLTVAIETGVPLRVHSSFHASLTTCHTVLPARGIIVRVFTGFQNIGIAMAIFKFTFDMPEGDIGAVICIACFSCFVKY